MCGEFAFPAYIQTKLIVPDVANVLMMNTLQVTRMIEDSLVAGQLDFANAFQARYESTGDDLVRVPVAGLGDACQALMTRPFVLASRRYAVGLVTPEFFAV